MKYKSEINGKDTKLNEMSPIINKYCDGKGHFCIDLVNYLLVFDVFGHFDLNGKLFTVEDILNDVVGVLFDSTKINIGELITVKYGNFQFKYLIQNSILYCEFNVQISFQRSLNNVKKVYKKKINI